MSKLTGTGSRTIASIGAAAFLLFFGLFAIWHGIGPNTDPGSGALDTSPGFSGDDRSLDTTPFQIPQSNIGGSTTIPGEYGEVVDPYGATTTSPPPVTTTTRPDVAVDPNDKACVAAKGLVETLEGSPDMSAAPQVVADRFALSLGQAATILREDPAGRYEAAAAEFSAAVEKLGDVETYDAIYAALAPFLNSMFKPDPVASTTPVIDHVRQACPSFLP